MEAWGESRFYVLPPENSGLEIGYLMIMEQTAICRLYEGLQVCLEIHFCNPLDM